MPTIHIKTPAYFGETVAESIRKTPIEHGPFEGTKSIDAWVVESNNKESVVVVRFPEFEPYKPTITELIEAWHDDPTPESRDALWDALPRVPAGYTHCGLFYSAGSRLDDAKVVYVR